MASIEFLQKRVESKTAEIAKLQKKMERVLKAKESNYEQNNPYSYSDYDFRVTSKELESAKNMLEDYIKKIEEETAKAASRNVPAITEFLDRWEQNCIEFYTDAFDRYLEAYKEFRTECDRIREELKAFGYKASWDKADPNYVAFHELEKVDDKQRKAFKQRWAYVTQFIGHEKSYDEYMRHVVAEEKKRKYDFILDRVCSIVNVITDASNLEVGAKGDLNGYIIGTDGTASVQTIGAGGYNQDIIVNEKHGQIFHYRTLIHKMK